MHNMRITLKKFNKTTRKYQNGIIVFAIVAIVLLFGATAGWNTSIFNYDSDQTQMSNTQEGPYKVQAVVDGDTIRVYMDGSVETIRLIGLDTPEVTGPYTEAECFGIESSARARELLSDTLVTLETDDSQDERDEYDRLLRYVLLPDGTNVNKVLIEEGYGYEYTFKTAYTHQAAFRQAQQDAQEASRGLWAPDTCNGQPIPLPDEITQNIQEGQEPSPGCIHFSDAPKHVGETVCVSGLVNNVFVSASDTTFINFCTDYKACAFSAVIFADNKDTFPDIAHSEGKQISINGRIDTYQGRPQIKIRQASQLEIQ